MISPEEASLALSRAADAHLKSRTLYGYGRGAPHLIIWGILWMAGFGLTDAFPARVTVIWSIVTLVGIGAGIAIDRSGSDRQGLGNWRYGVIALCFAGFSFAAFAIMRPHDINQGSAFICLVVALIYVLMGLWLGVRYIVAGLLVAALTLVGFFLVRNHFALWMALVGGSSLILTGLWLRKA